MAWIKLSKKNYFYNLSVVSEIVPKEKIAVVLKDNAYGHGLKEMALLASEFGVQKCVVRTIAEARQIQDKFPFILILSDKSDQKLQSNFHLCANELQDLKSFHVQNNICLKVDSGMHRNGIVLQDLEMAFEIIKKRNLKLSLVCTHSRSSDELTSEAFWQIKNFENLKKQIQDLCKKYNLPVPLFSFAASATVFRYKKEAAFDMVRVGIAAYGYLELPNGFKAPKLKPVLSLFAKRMSSKILKAGAKVGYSGGGRIEKDMQVSTYDIGYADGFFRLSKDRVFTTPKGYQNIGRMSMDSLSLDSTDEEVELFNDARSLANIFDTIVYDCLVKLNANIKRIIYE